MTDEHLPRPPLISTDQALRKGLPQLVASRGPVAIDTERASGFRYSQRAYLIQMKTPETGIWLIDPVDLSEQALAELNDALADKEWILHAASQDLPALRLSGLDPARLFDTEVSARLLGREKVGLGSLVEDVLGIALAKEHANSDWSERPLPDSWLIYAAGDVEYLIELADALRAELAEAGKTEWAAQEFTHILGATPKVKQDPWRSTTDIHTVRTRRGLAVVQQVWMARDLIAQELDLAPHRIVNDRAITALAIRATEDSVSPVLEALHWGDWKHRICKEHIEAFYAAVEAAGAMDPEEVPPMRAPRRGIPAPGLWTRKNPEAAQRWEIVRPAIKDLADTYHVPVENLIAPKPLKTVLWEPAGTDPDSLDAQFAQWEVRPWQRELIVPLISDLLTTLTTTPDEPSPESGQE